jgi:hypothetical protein
MKEELKIRARLPSGIITGQCIRIVLSRRFVWTLEPLHVRAKQLELISYSSEVTYEEEVCAGCFLVGQFAPSLRDQ